VISSGTLSSVIEYGLPFYIQVVPFGDYVDIAPYSGNIFPSFGNVNVHFKAERARSIFLETAVTQAILVQYLSKTKCKSLVELLV